jgi:hypothetical protein
MANVVNFRARAQQSGATQSDTPAAGDFVPGPAAPMVDTPLMAVREMRNAVLLLELAALHAREISTKIGDTDDRKAFEAHILSIEYALQTVREKTS